MKTVKQVIEELKLMPEDAVVFVYTEHGKQLVACSKITLSDTGEAYSAYMVTLKN